MGNSIGLSEKAKVIGSLPQKNLELAVTISYCIILQRTTTLGCLLSPIDSVRVDNCYYCEINYKGNLLLVQSNGEWNAYYKHNALKRKKIDENGIKYSTLKASGYKDITLWKEETVID